MADQAEPQANQRSLDQPSHPDNQAVQDLAVAQNSPPIRQFPAPAESFGPFGPLPDYPEGPAESNLPVSSVPFTPANVPPAWPNYQQPTPGPHPAFAGTAYPYPPGMTGTPAHPPHGMYPPPPRTKKPLRFPLTRHAPAPLQISGMLLYSLILALGFMGCALILLKAYVTNLNPYVNSDGSVNLLSILATCIIVLFIIPAWSVFSGVFFGSWRGLIVSMVSIAGGFLITHLTDPRFGNVLIPFQSYLPLAALPLTALVVGLVYDRRQYAAWWKSLLTMLLGATVLLLCFFTAVYIENVTSADITILAGNAHMSVQNYEAFMAIALGFSGLLLALPLGLFFAGMEALIHLIVTKVNTGRQIT